MLDVKEAVKSRVDITNLISEHVQLTKAGNSLKGRCPFHEEKTASLMVNPAKQTFHCFGCGAGGDIFEFTMKHSRVEFREALEILAKKAGVKTSTGNGNGRLGRIFAMNQAAVDFYRANLSKSPSIHSYLKDTRGLTDESIERFSIGCTSRTASLITHLCELGYSEKEILEYSLARRGEKQMRDYFFQRVIFPIKFQGKFRGFGGRVLDDSEPKYMNSAASSVFSKKDILFGLDPVGIKDKGYVLITEGYLDVIMAHQHEFKNTVAPMGTALTTDQITLLSKYCAHMYPVFDGDKAGERAAVKSAYWLFRSKIAGGIVILPQGEDLDSFLRKGGDLDRLVKQAVPFSAYLSRKAPKLRKRILEILMVRKPLEAAEFLAYESTPEERRMTAEMAAREGMRKIFTKAILVVRKDNVEVRKNDGFLALFSEGGFKLIEEAGSDYKQQATVMLTRYLQLKRTYSQENRENQKV